MGPPTPLETRPTNYTTMSGYRAVSSNMLCVITRVRLKHWWFLLPSYWRFRQIQRRALSVSGLLRSVFCVESPRTFYTISLWRNENAIPRFGNIHEHVATVRWTFRSAHEIWSSEWQLSGCSPRMTWNEEDLMPDECKEGNRDTRGCHE